MGIKIPTKGTTLERLVMSDQVFPFCPVVLTQMPQAAKRVDKGEVMAVRGPCDFIGAFKRVGTSIVFDAKECSNPTAFECGASKVKPHQVEQLKRYGSTAAIAGLIVLNTTTRQVHWCQWFLLFVSGGRDRVPSIPWEQMPVVGSQARGINWEKVYEAAGKRSPLRDYRRGERLTGWTRGVRIQENDDERQIRQGHYLP